MDFDSDVEQDAPLESSQYRMPSAEQLTLLRKDFEEVLKWRKKSRRQTANFNNLKQQARLLREKQEILLMKNDINMAALILDQRNLQASSLVQAAKNIAPAYAESEQNSYYNYQPVKKTSQFKRNAAFVSSSSSDDEDIQRTSNMFQSKRAPLAKLNSRPMASKDSFFNPSPRFSKRPGRN